MSKKSWILLLLIPFFLEANLSTSSNAFGYSLSQMKKNENILLSPYSLFTALSMLYIGADSETEKEIQKVLQTDYDKETLLEEFQNFSQLFPDTKIENSFWIDKKFTPLVSYEESLKKYFHIQIPVVDFQYHPKEALDAINEWIAKKTEQHIKDLLQTQDITSSTRAVLTNAVYFHGEWQYPFLKSHTQTSLFFTEKEISTETEMMNQTGKFNYFENGHFQVLELPFLSSSTICLIVLPKTFDESIDFLESSLSTWVDSLEKTRVSIAIPKFSFSYRFDLKETLQALGMQTAFSDQADFSKIDGQKDLYLSKLLHKAFIQFNEDGLTATAATAAIMNTTAIFYEEPPIPFIANHPFYFFLLDKSSKTILFLGKMAHP